ncbi:sodium:proton antiporter [Companilactobacillus sp. RD055328]|uniref:cation:proton antiporter n=1 Tax=Companilactobacillus sp. RD055328 TaxID=2916634 RepID=UPI001FC85862|nr:cation:proton antiporter [Companilactobacillus sp. RD055328]GKQ43417.1 sodium:proton antiporter [Companilactobacillus sp. RD055328]
METLIPIIIILIASLLISHIFNKIGVPAVLGILVLGVILGPGVTNIIKPTHLIEVFAEIGVILLMFIAGLESDLKLLKKYFRPSMIVAILGVVIPLGSVFIFNYFFGFSLKENIFVAIVFAATSVSISVEVLKSLNYLSTIAATTILGAAVADDIMAIFLLSVMTGSLTGTLSVTGMIIMVLSWVVFFVLSYFAIVKLIPYLNHVGSKMIASQSTIITALSICFLMAFLADWVRLDAVLGAFLAGIAYSEVKNKEEINNSIQTIGYSIFIPIFFVSIGLNISFDSLGKDLFLIISLTVIGILGKLLGSGFGAKLSGFSLDDSYIIGSGMISRGEMALIIAQAGFSANLMSREYYSAIIFAVVLTTLLAPLILRHAILRKSNHK